MSHCRLIWTEKTPHLICRNEESFSFPSIKTIPTSWSMRLNELQVFTSRDEKIGTQYFKLLNFLEAGFNVFPHIQTQTKHSFSVLIHISCFVPFLLLNSCGIWIETLVSGSISSHMLCLQIAQTILLFLKQFILPMVRLPFLGVVTLTSSQFTS